MRKRLRTLCIKTGGLLGAGLFYAFICILAGHPLIPCLFHTVTGLYCPGCGVSRMCLSILSLDFASAFKANAAVFLLLPPGLVMALRMAVRYVRTGNTRPTQVQTCVFYVMVGVLLVFGVVRNLPGFEGLRP
ncbi:MULTISPECIES: DUF2752 domain-containing protein [unclassified Clostridium]|uniref:DUF2752 domain-containing protein n=1 Tax=unclassified Clostridium TaxID=2614128 RepID=UPI001105F446|nr:MULTISPECIES: DUF2752 domain-containing protein [unclassified Clostridium]